MHSAPSRIIPMYPEEGALHELGDAGGGKRVKDRAMLILSQFSALVHGPCGDGAGGLALCEKALADLVPLIDAQEQCRCDGVVDSGMLRGGHRAALVPPAEEAWFNTASASAGRAVADLMWRAVVGSTGRTSCVVRTVVRLRSGSDRAPTAGAARVTRTSQCRWTARPRTGLVLLGQESGW
ncbi:hypothetical protein ACVWXU_008614 [Streptomyces sp. TE33382]